MNRCKKPKRISRFESFVREDHVAAKDPIAAPNQLKLTSQFPLLRKLKRGNPRNEFFSSRLLAGFSNLVLAKLEKKSYAGKSTCPKTPRSGLAPRAGDPSRIYLSLRAFFRHGRLACEEFRSVSECDGLDGVSDLLDDATDLRHLRRQHFLRVELQKRRKICEGPLAAPARPALGGIFTHIAFQVYLERRSFAGFKGSPDTRNLISQAFR
jgi:hypothetical protein